MKLKIGVVGVGVVGMAIKQGFEYIGHDVFIYDIKMPETKFDDVIDTDIVYVTVSTLVGENDECDLTAVYSVVNKLNYLNYKGLVALKSTVEPGTTDRLTKEYKDLRFCFVPEFLKERCAFNDFVFNNNILVVGVNNTDDYDLVVRSHGSLPVHKVMMTPVESELMKYFSNTYKATKITFAKSFHKVCQHFEANYSVIKDAFLFHGIGESHYLNVNEEFGGYAGVCLPKDTKAMKALCKKHNIDVGIFKFVDEENEKFIKKVPKGMRK